LAAQQQFKEKNMSNGTVTQIIGAVIDVEFDKNNIPKVYEALMVEESGTTLEVQQQIKIKTYNASNNEVKGANSKQELAKLEAIYRNMKSKELFNQGVTIADESRLDIRGNVTTGRDCSVDVNVIFEGKVSLGDNVSIGP
jgi:UDP-3-O-[3-hydroxymyristoyl] glucosamine N-acyltransferase